MSILKPLVANELASPGDILRVMRKDVVIRYLEVRHTERDVVGPEMVRYHISLAVTNHGEDGDPLDKYAVAFFTANQGLWRGVRAVFDHMQLGFLHESYTDAEQIRQVMERWREICPQWLRTWAFVGVSVHYQHERVVESCLIHPSDYWVRCQLSTVMGMLFQAGRPAYVLGLCDQLGRWMHAQNLTTVEQGFRP